MGHVPAEQHHRRHGCQPRPAERRRPALPDADEPLLQPRRAAPAGTRDVSRADPERRRPRLRSLPVAELVPVRRLRPCVRGTEGARGAHRRQAHVPVDRGARNGLPRSQPQPHACDRACGDVATAAGPHAIAYFPSDFSPAIGAQIALDKRTIESLVPALLEPNLTADAGSGSTVKVGAREHNGAFYVIAVNGSRESATATIDVPALGNRQLVSLDGTREVTASSGTFTDTFGPLEVHVYVSAPTGS